MVELKDPNFPVLVTAIISIVLSSLFYTWIWYKPSGFKKLVGSSDPCTQMAMWANILKGIQFASISALTDWNVMWERAHEPSLLLPALALVLFGQHLNLAVYNALGVNGVYYGNRFGKDIPWVKSYPYNVWQDMHPQYLGCLSSLLGVYILGIPQEICLWWASNYFYLMWLESRDPGIISVVS